MGSKQLLVVALIASVALNAFLASAILGRAVQSEVVDAAPADATHVRLSRLERLLRDAPPSAHAEIRTAYDAHEATVEAAVARLRAARLAYLSALRAAPFDPEAFDRAQIAVDSAAMVRRASTNTLRAEIAAALTDGQRLDMADRIEERWRRRWEQSGVGAAGAARSERP